MSLSPNWLEISSSATVVKWYLELESWKHMVWQPTMQQDSLLYIGLSVLSAVYHLSLCLWELNPAILKSELEAHYEKLSTLVVLDIKLSLWSTLI